MSTIADSSAYRDDSRLLSQHQAALTLLQSSLADPEVYRLDWLDLACGRGQIIAALDQNLSGVARSKIWYHAYDADQRYLREAERTAARLGLGGTAATLGDLSDFGLLVAPTTRLDFITFTNTAHEVRPSALASLLVDSVLRLSGHGCFFIYDVESVSPPELGAISWTRAEFCVIIQTLLQAFGVQSYDPAVGRWKHTSTAGWNVQIHRHHLRLPLEIPVSQRQTAVDAVSTEIRRLIRQKLMACRDTLESLTRFGSETPSEEQDKLQLLYDFWSLSRAIGGDND